MLFHCHIPTIICLLFLFPVLFVYFDTHSLICLFFIHFSIYQFCLFSYFVYFLHFKFFLIFVNFFYFILFYLFINIVIIILPFWDFFYTSISWCLLIGFWVTATLLKFPGLFSVFWLILIMLYFGWSPLVLLFSSPLVPLPILWGLSQVHQL